MRTLNYVVGMFLIVGSLAANADHPKGPQPPAPPTPPRDAEAAVINPYSFRWSCPANKSVTACSNLAIQNFPSCGFKRFEGKSTEKSYCDAPTGNAGSAVTCSAVSPNCYFAEKKCRDGDKLSPDLKTGNKELVKRFNPLVPWTGRPEIVLCWQDPSKKTLPSAGSSEGSHGSSSGSAH